MSKHCAKFVGHGAFRLFYTTEGIHAVSDDDGNRNGIPDRVDDILIQLIAADWWFENVLKLTPPLQQARYAHAAGIELHIMNLDTGSGLAFDEPTKPSWYEGLIANSPTLKIKLSARVDARSNPTPAHELFHLYQYGYTSFKTQWFTEGMARWIEGPFSKRSMFISRSAPMDCRALSGMSYNASVWFEALSVDYGKRIDFEKQPMKLDGFSDFRYVDGSPVFASRVDGRFTAVKTWLEKARDLTVVEGERLGVRHGLWPEALQRSNQFDEVLCNTLTKL
ncbi:hypothetical protein [Limnobacter sp.]|uniref:hypothetical protein n=1 Tax=Limnobacter sp. TaxID=2003368 RepID=UPI003518324E